MTLRYPIVPALSLLALLLAGCATSSSRASVVDGPTTKARGPEIIVLAGDRTHYFENRLPHCLAYTLVGEWDFGIQQAALRSVDARRRFLGVALQQPDDVPGPAGSDPVSRMVAYIVADTEKDWGRRVPSKVAPFGTARPGAVLLQFLEEVVVTPEAAERALGPTRPPVGQRAQLPLRVIAPFSERLVLIVTTSEPADAEQVLNTLETTEDPQCWQRAIRERFPSVRR